MKNSLIVLPVVFVLFVFSSCVSNKKITQLKQAVEARKSLENKLDSVLSALNSFRKEKNSIGELDDTSSVGIAKILNKETGAMKARTDSLTGIQNKLSGSRIKKREYKNMISILALHDTVYVSGMETVDFINLLLKQQTFIKFNTAAFFPSGAYIIPAEKLGDANMIFSPIIDSLLSFVMKFPKKTLVSSIIATGYADGTGFSPGELVNALSANIGKGNASKEELNLELSRLRAEDVSGILLKIFKEKIKDFTIAGSLNTRFFNTGKGEEYPNKKIKDYQLDDERRRIVVIYWNALPDEK